MPNLIRDSQTSDTSPRIITVDDEAYIRDLVSRWLTDAGFSCVKASNAQTAWDYLQTHEVHLAVMDINMPGRSGLELLGDIQKQYPDVAVLMMTAVSDTKTAVQALTNGAWGYLVKPVERGELLFQVRNALERRQLLVERREYTRQLEEKVHLATRAIRQAHEETIHRLASASLCRDEETGMHIRRTGLLSELLALAAGWPVEKAEILRMAAPMHDVGKIGIPDAILRKPGKLSPEEFEVMKTHTTIGGEMLAGSQSAILQMASQIALSHHERWDGTGYPQGLAGEDIPEASRIVTIVDVYDALTHDRVYRAALPEAQVLEYMQKGEGKHFDPRLLKVFFSCLDEVHQISEEHHDGVIKAENEPVIPTSNSFSPPLLPTWSSDPLDGVSI
jgi:putative two-component system response regulator